MKIDDYTFEEKQNALDEAHEVMNRVDETNAEREWLMNCKQFASADDIKKLVEKVNEYKSKLRYMTHHRDELAERAKGLEKERDTYKQLHKTYLDKFTSVVGGRNRLQEEMKKSIGWAIEYDADERLMFASDVVEELRRILEVSE